LCSRVCSHSLNQADPSAFTRSRRYRRRKRSRSAPNCAPNHAGPHQPVANAGGDGLAFAIRSLAEPSSNSFHLSPFHIGVHGQSAGPGCRRGLRSLAGHCCTLLCSISHKSRLVHGGSSDSLLILCRLVRSSCLTGPGDLLNLALGHPEAPSSHVLNVRLELLI
jgi:hypothetical protein